MEQYFMNGFSIMTPDWYLTYDQHTREYHLRDHTHSTLDAWDSYLAMYLQVMHWAYTGQASARIALDTIEELGKNYP